MIYRNCCQSFKKYDFEINAALELTPPLNKRGIGNAKNLINAAAFSRVNTVLVLGARFFLRFRRVDDRYF